MRIALVLAALARGGSLAVVACGGADSFEPPPFAAGPGGPPGTVAPPNGTLPQTTPARPNECGGVTIGAKQVPLFIVVALDRSNSMGNAGKWQAATNGLSAFFESPQSSVHASMSFFPQTAKSCGGDYVTPTVPMTELPSVTFRATFPQVGLLAGTPIRPALEGAANYAYTLQNQFGTSGRIAVALVSDGAPSANLCNGNTLQDVVTVAQVAAAAGVPTYAIGMPGAQQGNLDQIALAGGTVKGTLLDATDPGGQLTATFNQIRTQFSCEVELPSLSQGGQAYAPDQVNVLYTPNGGSPETLPHSVGCENGEGWTYDNAASPKYIELCPTSCAKASSGSGRTDVKFGCATEGDRPR